MAKLSTILSGYKGKTESIMRLSCAAIAVMTITRTPVKSGSARASWNPSIGKPVPSNVYLDSRSGLPTDHRNKITQVVNSMQVGDQFSLANGQPYIRKLEYDAHSAQAKNGMLRRSVAQWQATVDEVAKNRGIL